MSRPIPLFKPFVSHDIDKPLLETLHSGYITEGQKVKDFEAAFSAQVDNPYVVAVNSGTSALTLALRLAGVGSGDEVVTTAMTCTATNLPILSLGAIPVFADVDPDTGLIDPYDVALKVTEKTKAIMVCDWGGSACDLDALMATAKRHGIKVIEDSAHALGAYYNHHPVGSVADYTCFSLQAIKHITTVDGGFLTVKNEEDYKRAKKLRWFGIDREGNGLDSRINQDIEEWGYKFHMNDVTATIGLAQLPHLPDVAATHRRHAAIYNELLSPDFKRDFTDGSSFWLFTIQLPSKLLRNKFKEYMTKKDIGVNEVHRRNDEYKVFKPFATQLPNTTLFANRMVCIPVHAGLSDKDVEYVAKTANKFIAEFRQYL